MRLRIVCVVIVVAVVALFAGYAFRRIRSSRQLQKPVSSEQTPQTSQRPADSTSTFIPISDGFEYPIWNNKRTSKLTQTRDGDGWYNAQDFGENNHLGEDWNTESGGNTDCGIGVYASSNGTIVFAKDGGIGWGKVLIVRHRLSDDTFVETLYGHLQSFTKTAGDVKRHEQLGSIGNADGAYPCHLHFELRLADCASWGMVGPGYSENRDGWTDPSNFIDAHRASTPG